MSECRISSEDAIELVGYPRRSMSVVVADPRLEPLWRAVDRLLAGASTAGILAHKLGPLAANRLRRLGEPVPPSLVLEERAASIAMLLAVPLLERVRATYDGNLVLIKGPEIARLYPGRARLFSDLDILANEAADVQATLVNQGFVEYHDPLLTARWHHLTTLGSDAGLKVEMHKSPRWPGRLRPPTQEIFEASVPSALGVAGISTPTPLHHALIIAVHAWHHEPLWTLRDLIDIAAISALVDEQDLDRTAAAWEIGRLWRTTQRAIDALFYGGRDTFPLGTWARHLRSVRDRTGIEKHVAQLSDGFWGMPLHLAPVRTLGVLRYMIRPASGESWRDRVTRIPRDFRKLRAPVGRRTAPPT